MKVKEDIVLLGTPAGPIAVGQAERAYATFTIVYTSHIISCYHTVVLVKPFARFSAM